MRTITGVNEMHDAGQSLKTHQTATAVAAREDAMNMRTSEKNTKIETMVISMFRKTLGQAQLMLAKPVRARAAVRAGGDPMVVDRAMLAAVDLFDVRIELGSMMPVDSATQRQIWLHATEVLAQNPYIAQMIDWTKWMPELLGRMGVESPEMFMLSPQQQQQQPGLNAGGAGAGPTAQVGAGPGPTM